MKKTNILFFLLFLGIYINSSAQDTLSIESAIGIALEQNFDIQLTENQVKSAENNQSLLNSNYLPTVSARANTGYANGNTSITNQNDITVDVIGAESINYGGSLSLNYMLFNGFGRKNSFEKLKTLYNLANVQKKEQIDNVLLSVYSAYYQVAKSSLQIDIIKEAYEISKQRLVKVNYQYDYAQKTKLDVLNAQVDANNDSLTMVSVKIQLENAKRNLNSLLGESIEKEFVVHKEVEIDDLLDYEVIKQLVDSNNYLLQQVNFNKTISEYDLKINKAAWMPSVSTSASYNLNNNLFDDQNTYAAQDYNGLNVGLNLSWNIFDGGSSKVRSQNLKINIENQDIYKKQLLASLENQLLNAWANYSNQIVIIRLEKENVRVNTENFDKTKERYNLGQINSIEFRQAQLNLINSKVSLLNAQFDMKLAELKLKKLSGILLSE